MSDKVDALVIFGATGDLAKLETFPALVGLVKRGVLDVPVVGVAKSGWGLEQFRIWPETAVSLTLQGKKPGAGWEPQPEDLTFAEQPGSDIRPYDRLIGAARQGDRWLFARQDTVESAWRIVDPVLGDVVPVHPYARGSLGRRRPTGC
jgi:glucose-6-phosphate 1-dehydrogenase